MGFSALQIILVFVWVFIVAIDQFDFLESLYQPIVSGAVIGAILGDLPTGLIVGGTYQLMTIGNMPGRRRSAAKRSHRRRHGYRVCDLFSSGYHCCCRSGSSLRSDRPVHGYLPVHPHVPHDVQG